MRLYLCVITCIPDLFHESVSLALENADEPVCLIGFGNGCFAPMTNSFDVAKLADKSTIFSDPNKNHGIPYALQQIYESSLIKPGASANDVLVYIHDDFLLQERGWDRRVLEAFECNERLGLAGFGGSTGLGRPGIYSQPYAWQQVCRTDFFSNMRDAEFHGKRATAPMPIVYTDGQSMIVRRALLDQIDGWRWWPFDIVHHGYDYGIACQARRHGWEALLIPCACEHKITGSSVGAVTRDSDIYRSLADKHGGDEVVFQRAHRFVYDNFRDVLPMRVP